MTVFRCFKNNRNKGHIFQQKYYNKSVNRDPIFWGTLTPPEKNRTKNIQQYKNADIITVNVIGVYEEEIEGD